MKFFPTRADEIQDMIALKQVLRVGAHRAKTSLPFYDLRRWGPFLERPETFRVTQIPLHLQ